MKAVLFLYQIIHYVFPIAYNPRSSSVEREHPIGARARVWVSYPREMTNDIFLIFNFFLAINTSK